MNGKTDSQAKILAALLTVGLTSGSAAMLIKLTVQEITPIDLVGGRLITALVPLAILMYVRRIRLSIEPGLIASVGVLAILDSVVPFSLVAWASVRIDSGIAALLISTMPLFTTLFAAIVRRSEKLSAVTGLGMGLGFLGVLFLGNGGHVQGSMNPAGIGAMLVASASYAAGAVYARPLMKKGDPIGLTGLKIAIACLLVLPFVIARGGVGIYAHMHTASVVSLLVLGVGSTGLSRCLYLWIIGTAGSVKASLVTYLVPVIGLALGVVVLHEHLSTFAMGGSALIVAGAGVVMFADRVRGLIPIATNRAKHLGLTQSRSSGKEVV